MKKRKIYIAIIDDGLMVRSFRSLLFMCKLFNLDYMVIRDCLYDKGHWCGLKMTIFISEIETERSHNGRL